MPEQSNTTSKKYYDPVSMAKRTIQVVHRVDEHDKMSMLEHIMKHSDDKRTVIITKSKKIADELGVYLNTHDLKAKVIHGNHRKSDYEETAKAFNSDESKVLITTDMVLQALGLENVERVVSFDIPMEADNYGKSLAFVDEKGMSISLVTPEDEGLFLMIEMLLKIEIEDAQVEGFTHTDPSDAPKKVLKEKKKKPRHRSQTAKKVAKKEEEIE